MENENIEVVAATEEKKHEDGALKKLKNKGFGFFSEFKKFISKGNIMNLAIGLVMGSAFTAIVNSLVADIIMPVISLFFGKNNLADFVWHITDDITLSYGKFILAILNFLIIALVLFIVIRTLVRAETGLSHLKKAQKKAAKNGTPPPAETPVETAKIESTEDILKDIRTLLTSLNPPVGTQESKEEKIPE